MIIEIKQGTEGILVELTPMNAAEEKIVREASIYAKALNLDLIWWGDTGPPDPENEDERLVTQGIKIHAIMEDKVTRRRSIKVVLFQDGKHLETRDRCVVPSVGDTIVIDCGHMVKVTEVNHQWDDPTFVQIGSEQVKEATS